MSLLDKNILVDGVRLAYRDRGQGEPVVFVHGTPSYSYEWRRVVPRVEAAGFRVITYDLLGYGDSERPLDRDTSVAGQSDLLVELLDELGIGQASLITHDIGGAIGQRLAIHHAKRVNRLMMIDTVSYDSWPSATWRQIIADGLDAKAAMNAEEFAEMLSRQLRMTVASEVAMAGSTLDAFLEPHRSRLGRVSFFQHQVSHYDSRYTLELVPRLKGITVPVRILWGERDEWQPVSYARRLASDIPNAELVLFPRAGHFLMEDEPEAVTAEVLDFLST